MRGRNISLLIFRIRAVHTVYDVTHILIFHAGFLFLRLIFCRHKILDLNRRDVIYERPHIFLPFSFSLDLVRYPRNRIVKWDLLKLGIVSKNLPLWSRSKNYILGSISPTFIEQLLHQFPFAKKITNTNCMRIRAEKNTFILKSCS